MNIPQPIYSLCDKVAIVLLLLGALGMAIVFGKGWGL